MKKAHIGQKSAFTGKKHTNEAIKKMRESKFSGKIKVIRLNGYIYQYAPDHPKAICGRIPEQVLIMEKLIGRLLATDEIVHHIDGNKLNNIPENLRLMTTKEHRQLHAKQKGFGTIIQSNPQRDKITGKFISSGRRQ